jgi:hypothetical protein
MRHITYFAGCPALYKYSFVYLKAKLKITYVSKNPDLFIVSHSMNQSKEYRYANSRRRSIQSR